jgi:hypothetical protein
MSRCVSVLVVSDIHHAGEEEKSRGQPRIALSQNPLLQGLMRAWDRLVWVRDPLAHNHLLNRFLEAAGPAEWVVANGDFACDAACVGVSDDAALASARECLHRLRAHFGERLMATFGDHELGKTSFVGQRGGMRLESWKRAVELLHLRPLWRIEAGRHVLLGVASPLIGLDVYRPDALTEEWPEWERLRARHVAEVGAAFQQLSPGHRVVLFCHDPSALPYLRQLPEVAGRLAQIELTVVGHLHSEWFLRQARRLAGFPTVTCLGPTVRRWTQGLNAARRWRDFNVVLCPSLAGIELDRCGGWLTLELDPEGGRPIRVMRHEMRR